MATPLRLQLQILTSGTSASVGELRRIREESARAAAESEKSTTSQQRGNTLLGGGIGELSFRYNEVVRSLQNLRATAQPVYDALIASNEKLNAQILSSQTNLASATRIFKGDVEITDPTAKIQASAGKLRAAIKQIEIDTQSLVGVTSEQVNELFQITLTNAAALNNQSKQFPDSISAATSLTKGWAASLKVVGIPLQQARQEINSIIKGQITQDSILAKNLNITNQQVEQWRSQGRLVDELNKKLDVFVAGNAIAARSIEGISSNILDLGQRIARNIGEPYLEPIINALAAIEKYLKDAEASINAFFGQLSAEILSQGKTIAEAFAPLGKTLLEIGEDLGPIALSAIKGILSVLTGLAQVIAPIANTLAGVVKVFADFAATDLGGVVVQTAAVVLVLGQLQAIITGLAIAALPGLAAALLPALVNLQSFLTAAQAIAAANGIPVATAAIQILQAQLVKLAATATATLLPLAALTAAIGLTVLVRTTRDMEDANEALEAYGQQVLDSLDGVLNLSSELNQLNKIRKEGGTLTEEQIKREKQLRASAQVQAEAINERIKLLKTEFKGNADQLAQRDNLIKQLEAQRDRLEKATGGLRLEANALEDLGTTAELAKRKLEDFNRQIKSEANGDKPAFEAALKGKVALIQSEVAQKRLTVEAARAELEAVKNNTKAELEIRNSAKDAIDKLYDGRIAKIKELIETEELQSGSGLDELAKIRDDATLEASTRRKAGQQIVAIRKEQIAAESAAIAAGQAEIAARTAQQRIGEAKADEESTKLKLAEVAKRIEGIKAAEANATSQTERKKLKAEREKEGAEADKIEAELAARRRKRALEDFDERRSLLKAQNDLGLTDRATYSRQVYLNDTAQNELAIAQQRQALGKLAAGDKQGREAINSQIAQLQSKKIEIVRAFEEREQTRQKERYDRELTALEALKNKRLLSESDYNRQVAANRIAQADAEIALARKELERRGAADVEGRAAINARINEAEARKLKALEQSYAAQLALEKDRQDKALAIVTQSEQQRTIALQKLLNKRGITQEAAEQERARSAIARQKAELQQARDFEAALAKTATAKRTPEAERAYQQQVRDARARTTQLTIGLLEKEGAEQERVRALALKRVEDESAARTRAVDLQLSQLNTIKGERDRAGKAAEAAAAREVQAAEIATKALDRQVSLLQAKTNLQKARFESEGVGQSLELQQVVRSLEIRKRLDTEANLSARERSTLERELASYVGNSSISELELVNRKQAIEARQAVSKRESLLFEQQAARASLVLEQQKNDLATKRAVIEAKIAEYKAKQGISDAQSLARQTELNNKKSIEAAQLARKQAGELKPGRERDRAIADADAKLKIARDEAKNNGENAQQGIDLARQQADFATQNRQQAEELVKSQAEIKRYQTETLDIQQQNVLRQHDAAEGAKRWADELERGKAALNSSNVQVNRGTIQDYLPNAAGFDTPAPQIRSNLTPSLDLAISPTVGASSNREVVEAVNRLQTTIENRKPQINTEVTFGSPDSQQTEDYYALQRTIARGMV